MHKSLKVFDEASLCDAGAAGGPARAFCCSIVTSLHLLYSSICRSQSLLRRKAYSAYSISFPPIRCLFYAYSLFCALAPQFHKIPPLFLFTFISPLLLSVFVSLLSQSEALQLNRLMSSPWLNLTPVDDTAKTCYTWHSNTGAGGISLVSHFQGLNTQLSQYFAYKVQWFLSF